MRKILKLFIYLWQLPQMLVGLLICNLIKDTQSFDATTKTGKVYHGKVYFADWFNSAVCLGKYIIVDKKLKGNVQLCKTIKHELGHSVQSILLGWFYFIVVGIPSFVLNIISRICKKDEQWYYSKFPENWANKLAEGIITIELK